MKQYLNSFIYSIVALIYLVVGNYVFAQDREFPVLMGNIFIVVNILSWGVYNFLQLKSVSILLINILFTLTMPLYLFHTIVDHEYTSFAQFIFDYSNYMDILVLSTLANLALIFAMYFVFRLRTYRFKPSLHSQTSMFNNIDYKHLFYLSIFLYAVSLIVSYKTGIGIVGYIPKPGMPFILGFSTRMSKTIVPLYNVLLLDILLKNKDFKKVKYLIVIILTETILLVIVSLSRFVLLSYIILPFLFVFIFHKEIFKSILKLKYVIYVMPLLLFIFAGIILADFSRFIVFGNLVSGAGYVEIFSAGSDLAQNFDVGEKVTGSIFFFFERLTGMRELMWVQATMHHDIFSVNFLDLYYTIVNGPPASDPMYILRPVLGFDETVNEDTGFGSSLSLLANILFASGVVGFFFAFLLILLLIYALELSILRLFKSETLTFYFTSILVIDVWQGNALNTFLQRPTQMMLIGILLIFILNKLKNKAHVRNFRGSL